MLRLLAKSVLLLGLVTASCLIIVSVPPYATFYAAFLDKQVALARAVSPKVIIVGGSGAAFGVDSRALEDHLRMSAVNMGLFAGVGLSFMLEHVGPHVGRGDLVVILPEYEILGRGFVTDDFAVASMLFAGFPRTLRYFAVSEYGTALRGFSFFAYDTVLLRPLSVFRPSRQPAPYPREWFDDRGDVVGHLGLARKIDDAQVATVTMGEASIDEAIAALDRFDRLATARGARALFGFPAIIRSVYDRNRPRVEAIEARLRARLTMPILGRPEDYAFPVELFYDTAYHLNERGRVERMRRLIPELGRHLPPGGPRALARRGPSA